MNAPRIECEKGTFRITTPDGETWLLHVGPAPNRCAWFELYATHGDARRLRITRTPTDMPAHELVFHITRDDQAAYDFLIAEVAPIVAMVRYE